MPDETTPLQELLYNFTVLHERWTADKLDLTKQIIKTEQLIKDFTVRIHEFQQVTASVKYDLNSTLRETVRSINAETASAIEKSATDKIANIIRDLSAATFAAKQEINKWQQEAISSTCKAIVVGVFSSFLVSLITVKFLL